MKSVQNPRNPLIYRRFLHVTDVPLRSVTTSVTETNRKEGFVLKVKLTPKQYLNQAYHLNEMIESHIAELRMLRETIDGLSAVNYEQDKVTSSNTSSPVEMTVSKIIALEEKINAEIDRFVDLKTEIHTEISKVSDQTEQLVLRLRYIQFKSWPDIQAVIGKRERAAYTIHSTALNHFKVPDSPFAFREKF